MSLVATNAVGAEGGPDKVLGGRTGGTKVEVGNEVGFVRTIVCLDGVVRGRILERFRRVTWVLLQVFGIDLNIVELLDGEGKVRLD